MRLKAAFEGNLSDFMEKEYQNAALAVTSGIKQATEGLKNSMRSQVKGSGLSLRLANTWRGDVFPKAKKSIRASGVVYTKAPQIMEGFEFQTIIRGKNGLWLAIPTEAIKKKIYGKKMTPFLYERWKGVKLRFVYRSFGVSLLVHEQKKKTIIAFNLVPQAKMPKLINFTTESQRWQDKVPELILRSWNDE